jgi:hypothetical protein
MERTKIGFLNKLVHQTILQEEFLPGVIFVQTKFGVLQFTRAHGNAIEVFHLIARLGSKTKGGATFIDRDAIEGANIDWERCQDEVNRFMVKESQKKWKVKPQPDDKVEPELDIHLVDTHEQIIFHQTIKDVKTPKNNCYTNADIIITTGRIFFWERQVYKKFDCMACPCWCFVWLAFTNKIFNPKNLGNTMSFLSLPSVLSFSTDMALEQPSWFVPHQTPLKVPLVEAACAALTALVTMNMKRLSCQSFNPCPTRPSQACNMTLMWRVRQSAHADKDFVLLETIRPYVPEELDEQEALEMMKGMGYVMDNEDGDKAQMDLERLVFSADMKVETLRTIMSVVQDRCEQDFAH